jgi:sporulation protein YlmC with PRC-barrel domain
MKMRIKLAIAVAIFPAVCGSLPAGAQITNDNDRTTRERAADQNMDGHASRDVMPGSRERLGRLEKASKIIGTEIVDSSGQKLGKVEDLAIDLRNGRIVEVIIATGGILSIDEHYSAVPPELLAVDPAEKTLKLNGDKERFQRAPAFKISAWESDVQEDNVRVVYQYYNARPYFAGIETSHVKAGTTNELGAVERASKIMGSVVRNQQNEKLGTVDNLLINLPAGRLSEVVVASGGFLGIGDELSAVPPQAFHRGVERDLLLLDKTKEDLAQAPHFKSNEWPDLNSSDAQANAVYRSYSVEPYFSTNAVDNTAQNVRDRQDNATMPLSQGASQADVDTSRKIRQQIMALNGLSVDARNVKIITVNGRVTLRGPVDNADEKRQITEIANRVATSAQVDNQLQVKNDSNNPSPLNQ